MNMEKASFIQNCFLNIDPTTNRQIIVAPTTRQAEEVLSLIKTTMNQAEEVLSPIRTSQNTTGLEIRPMNIAKLQGLRTKISTVDEWL